jgi:hypothetical protein
MCLRPPTHIEIGGRHSKIDDVKIEKLKLKSKLMDSLPHRVLLIRFPTLILLIVFRNLFFKHV